MGETFVGVVRGTSLCERALLGEPASIGVVGGTPSLNLGVERTLVGEVATPEAFMGLVGKRELGPRLPE